MTLSMDQLRRLLWLTYGKAQLSTTEEIELRELVRLEGYPKEASEKSLEPTRQLGKGILMAYYFVDGVDFTAEAA